MHMPRYKSACTDLSDKKSTAGVAKTDDAAVVVVYCSVFQAPPRIWYAVQCLEVGLVGQPTGDLPTH